MIDLFRWPPGTDTLLVDLGTLRGPHTKHSHVLWRAGARSIDASALVVALWMMWRHGDGRDVVAAGVITMVCALVGLIRLRSPTAASGLPPLGRGTSPESSASEAMQQVVTDDVDADWPAAVAVDDDDLRQAEKMETIGRCVGEFAHDFNNLLTVVICNIDRASRSAVPGTKAFAHLADAALASERAAGLVADILTFSRRQPAPSQRVDIDRLLVAMRPLIRSVTDGCAVDFELGCPWRCRAAPNQLETAVLNMVVNARDAMPNGGRLTIRTSGCCVGQDDASLRAGEYVALTVSDTGIGMTAEVAARAFEPFFTTKPAGRGTGLGLSQIAGFARRVAGAARIESAPGLGTRVSLLLPRCESELPE